MKKLYYSILIYLTMKFMRNSTKKGLRIVLYNLLLNKKLYSTCGLCYLVSDLPLNLRYSSNIFIHQNKPTCVENKFFTHPTFTGGTYWWLRNTEGQKQRIKFIQHLLTLKTLSL